MSRHAGFRWMLCSCWMAFMLLAFVSAYGGDDFCEDKTLKEMELTIEIATECGSQEAEQAKAEQCNDAAENLIDECRDHCVNQSQWAHEGRSWDCLFLMVSDKKESTCRSSELSIPVVGGLSMPVATIWCKRSVECVCNAINAD